jgi:NADH dehydrogenase (ubiquinone) Fe-S protein 6
MLSRSRLVVAARRLTRASSSTTNTPASVPSQAPAPAKVYGQAPNRAEKWTTNQQSRPQAGSIPRFEQTDMALQPNPLSAMELIANEPIRLVHGRKAVCDGGEKKM